jgi:FkbM family methyltransferase
MKTLKSIVRRCLEITPYEIKRRRNCKAVLPPATVDNIILALAYYVESKRLSTFVQIGACDGVSGDSSHYFIKRGQMRAVLVEPIPQLFCKLQAAYEGIPNVSLVQAAIAEHDGAINLYKVKEGANSLADHARWSFQLASFSKAHLMKHGFVEVDIEEVTVPCLTLASLMTNCGLDRIDVLQVDAEGFDAEIVKMALRLPLIPECISFENVHLDDKAQVGIFTLLEQHGYKWTHDHWNTLALHEQLLRRLVRRD